MSILRQLADQQQFELLRGNAEAFLAETGEVNALPLLALACAQRNDRAAAEAALRRLNQVQASLGDALDLDARVDLAAAHILTGRLPLAISALEAAVAERPGHDLALARLAFCRMQTGDLDEARALYRRSVELAPHRLPAWSALARLDLEAGNVAAAEAALAVARVRLAEQDGTLSPTACLIFRAQLDGLQLEVWGASGRLAAAEAWLEAQRAALVEDEWVGYLIGYANVLAGHDRHAEAETALREALQHTPENFPLMGQLAELALVQGRSLQAIQILRSALALARRKDEPVPRQIWLWVRLTDACLRGLTGEARAAAEEAVALAEQLGIGEGLSDAQVRALRWQAKSALAQVECDERHFDRAETLFNEILADNPWFLPALQGLGQQQMQRGRLDEAVALFERVQQIDPAKGISSLINARQIPDDSETLERLERLARQPSLEGSARSGLLFQLAAAWEKKKDDARAFGLAQEANEASRKHLRYDPRAHRQRCARIRHAFTKALFEHRQDCGYRGQDESLPVFVLGMPRSGTTLVEQILAGHSQISGAGELGVIPSRIQGLNRWERRVGSGREYPDCVDDLNPHATRGIAEGVLKELKELAAEAKPQARFVIDKLPHNFENIGFIKFLFPQARIISVRRDPRDIAISNYFIDYAAKHGGMGFAYDLGWIGEQLADHNLLMRHWHQTFPGEILEINYEDVVEDTEGMARRMLDYIGVPWEPQVLAFDALDRPVKTASVWQVRQPIYKTSKAKWERYQAQLAPLIAGTNARVTWEPIEMPRFPTPGMFTDGVALYRAEQLDAAEYEFKKVLHHFPEHAAAHFMVGLIYVHKGHVQEGIAHMERGLEKCPWNRNWRQDLIQACEMAGDTGKAEGLRIPKRWAAHADEAGGPAEEAHVALEWPVTTTGQNGIAG
nr:sulfotransferase [Ideonella oryzae]